MQSFYSLIALDLARERAEQAREQRRLALARSANTVRAAERPSALRRGLAQTLAAVSRGSASVARRLDDGLAEDIVQGLSPTR
jgi:hypothetical protein